MFRLESPGAFLLLLLIPLYFILRKTRLLTPPALPLTLRDWEGESFEWKAPLTKALLVLKTICILLFFLFTVCALARPVLSRERKIYYSEGASIIFVLDVSPSMAAADMDGKSRIESAKSAIRTIAGVNEGAALGLVEMAESASCLIPPTTNRAFFNSRLDSVTVGDLGDGTAIGNGLSCAVFHLDRSTAPKKSIVLITDGENNSGTIHPHTAAKLAARKNISLYILGVGTKGLVPINYTDPKTKKNYQGYLDSNFDTTSIARIASAGEGAFFETDSLAALSDAVSSINRAEYVSQTYRTIFRNEPLYKTFLCAACMFALLAWFIKRVLLREAL